MLKIFKKKKRTIFSEWEELEKIIHNPLNTQEERLKAWSKRYDSYFRHCDYIPWANYNCEPFDEEILENGLLEASSEEIDKYALKKIDKIVAKQKEEYMREKAEPILWALNKFFGDKNEK